MAVNKRTITIYTDVFAGILVCVLISCIAIAINKFCPYFYDEDIAAHIAKNPLVADARVLGSEFDVPTNRYDIEINTISGYRICLHYVKRSCRNREISVEIINDIQRFGGRGYVLRDGDRIDYDLDDFVFLGKMLGKNFQSVDDIVENAEELYGLFELFEANAGKEFMYGEKFLIYADFRRGEPDPDWPV